MNALKVGHQRLVLRIWYGGSSWWNLHRNTNPIDLARKEIMGYQIAHTAFFINTKERNYHPRIPRVIYFDDDTSQQSSLQPPWAVLEYVGPDSLYLKESCVDTTYFDGMIKVRKEFGFDEPHPRWGRVPTDQSLQYSRLILHQVMIPLHYQTTRIKRNNLDQKVADVDHNQHHQQQQEQQQQQQQQGDVHTYFSMIRLYRDAYISMMKNLSTATVSNDIHKLSNNQSGSPRMKDCLERLNQLLIVLESNVAAVNTLPPALVHMDLQPQNLIFCKSDDESKNNGNDNTISIFSVLDWEDTGWADLRFDLLLLCRKVCSNRNQAENIWSEYETSMNMMVAAQQQQQQNPVSLGLIDPWLQLETVHSITTMLLQSMDLLNGGRNPWETKTDLWGKLEREFIRWDNKHCDGIDDE